MRRFLMNQSLTNFKKFGRKILQKTSKWPIAKLKYLKFNRKHKGYLNFAIWETVYFASVLILRFCWKQQISALDKKIFPKKEQVRNKARIRILFIQRYFCYGNRKSNVLIKLNKNTLSKAKNVSFWLQNRVNFAIEITAVIKFCDLPKIAKISCCNVISI